MAGYDQSGYVGNQQGKPSGYNAYQGYKEGDDFPASEGGNGGLSAGVPHHQLHSENEPLPQPRGGVQDDQGEETYQDAPSGLGDAGDAAAGVGGAKSAYGTSNEGTGAYDRPTGDQSQFGLEGRTGTYGSEGSDPRIGDNNTSNYGATDPLTSGGMEPAGAGFGPEDTSPTHGAKKVGLVTKIKEKLPGSHTTDADAFGAQDSSAPPKKGVVEKIKEKLPGHHGSSTDM